MGDCQDQYDTEWQIETKSAPLGRRTGALEYLTYCHVPTARQLYFSTVYWCEPCDPTASWECRGDTPSPGIYQRHGGV